MSESSISWGGENIINAAQRPFHADIPNTENLHFDSVCTYTVF